MHPRRIYPSGSRRSVKRSEAGFTLIELFAALAIISLLLVLILPALAKAQTKMRANRCVSNLQDVGTAMSLYLQDSNDKFPYAGLRYATGTEEHHLAWDDLMGPYLGIDMTLAQRSQDGASGSGSYKLLACPQDTAPVRPHTGSAGKEYRRSYSLPEHNLGLNNIGGRAATAADWPPCPVNRTGIGLTLDGRPGHLSNRWNPDDEPGSNQKPRWQAAFQTSMILDAANTLFLTERFDGDNRVGSLSGATIGDLSQHAREGTARPPEDRFNYLMVDGHVESLIPQDSYLRKSRTASKVVATTAPTGIWTIWQDD